jgi:hypothetical protein
MNPFMFTILVEQMFQYSQRYTIRILQLLGDSGPETNAASPARFCCGLILATCTTFDNVFEWPFKLPNSVSGAASMSI